ARENELVAALQALPEGGRVPAAESRPASEERPPAEPRREEAGASLHLEIVLRQGTPLPAARAAVILKHLADLGRVAEVSPPPATMASGGFDGRFRLTLETRAGAARVRAIVLDIPCVFELHPGPARA